MDPLILEYVPPQTYILQDMCNAKDGRSPLQLSCHPSSRLLGFCWSPDEHCGQWHSPLIVFCLGILVDFLHNRAGMWHREMVSCVGRVFSSCQHCAASAQEVWSYGGKWQRAVGGRKTKTQNMCLDRCKWTQASAIHLRTLACTHLTFVQYKDVPCCSLSFYLTFGLWVLPR